MKKTRTLFELLLRWTTRSSWLALLLVTAVAIAAEANPFAYVTHPNSNIVSVIDLADGTVVATVSVGTKPMGVAITPDGAFAYMTNFDSDFFSVIDTATNTVVATVPEGAGPCGVAITPF